MFCLNTKIEPYCSIVLSYQNTFLEVLWQVCIRWTPQMSYIKHQSVQSCCNVQHRIPGKMVIHSYFDSLLWHKHHTDMIHEGRSLGGMCIWNANHMQFLLPSEMLSWAAAIYFASCTFVDRFFRLRESWPIWPEDQLMRQVFCLVDSPVLVQAARKISFV